MVFHVGEMQFQSQNTALRAMQKISHSAIRSMRRLMELL